MLLRRPRFGRARSRKRVTAGLDIAEESSRQDCRTALGFSNEQAKAEFMKDPEANLAKAVSVYGEKHG